MTFADGSSWVRGAADRLLIRIDAETNQVVEEYGPAASAGAVALGFGAVWISAYNEKKVWPPYTTDGVTEPQQAASQTPGNWAVVSGPTTGAHSTGTYVTHGTAEADHATSGLPVWTARRLSHIRRVSLARDLSMHGLAVTTIPVSVPASVSTVGSTSAAKMDGM